jgi:hypothetical protein
MRSKVIADIVDEWRRLSTFDLPLPSDPKQTDLPKAAAALALAGVPRYARAGWPELFWPWRRPRFKPSGPRENLVRAAALILAELERQDQHSN